MQMLCMYTLYDSDDCSELAWLVTRTGRVTFGDH